MPLLDLRPVVAVIEHCHEGLSRKGAEIGRISAIRCYEKFLVDLSRLLRLVALCLEFVNLLGEFDAPTASNLELRFEFFEPLLRLREALQRLLEQSLELLDLLAEFLATRTGSLVFAARRTHA